MSAPARNVASLAHTTSSVTYSQPTKVPKPQSTPAITRSRSPDRGHHCLDALRNHLGMFDDVALRIDHTGDQDQFVGQLRARPQTNSQTATSERMSRPR
jgi:hypothetical protein